MTGPWSWRCLRCGHLVATRHVRAVDGQLHHIGRRGYCGLIERVWLR